MNNTFRIENTSPMVKRTLQLAGVAVALGLEEGHGATSSSADRARRREPASSRSDDSITEALDALSQHFVGDSTMGETLARITRIARSALAQVDHASISMSVDGRLGAETYADPEIGALDRAQYEKGDGPAIDALLTGKRVVVQPTSADGPYEGFRSAARTKGILAVLCTPMRIGAKVVGALTLYSTSAEAFSDIDLEIAGAFATRAAFVVVNTKAYWDARTLSENLAQAMQSRAEIEQAKGIIMATAGLTADAAFEQLVKQSQHENIKVRDLATEIVRRSQRGRHP